MGRKLSGREVQSISDPRFDIRCLDAWRLRCEGLTLNDIGRNLNVTQTVVSRYLLRAGEIVREKRKAEEQFDFERHVENNEYVRRKLMDRIEESIRPTLDRRMMDEDIKSGAVKAFLFDAYMDDGVVNSVALKRDLDSGVSLGPLRKYIIEGRLDTHAAKTLMDLNESDRKLLGLDRNKHRLELSAAEGTAAEVAKDAIDQIAQIARKRAAIREIEVKAKEVGGA